MFEIHPIIALVPTFSFIISISFFLQCCGFVSAALFLMDSAILYTKINGRPDDESLPDPNPRFYLD